MWPITVKIYWDPWRNIPVIKPKQEEIDLLYQLKLSEPGDARPAFPGDIEKLKAALVYEFGTASFFTRFMEGRFLLLNKVPHWDVMYEVVASGNVLGQLYYDPFVSKWRFRPTFQGTYLAVQENLVEVVKADPPYYSGRVVSKSYSTSSRLVAVVDAKGSIRGLGEVREGEGVVLVKTFYDKALPVETSNKPSTIADVLKYNEDGLNALEEKSIKFLERLGRRYSGLSRVVSYSGGKDSLVALDLAVKAFGNVEMLFNDTGLEMPETLKNVEEVSNHYGIKLHIASAGDIFWRAVELFGPPGKDYRWCCKVTKLTPIAKLAKAAWPSGGLNIVGQRAYESLDRARSPLIWRNKWIRHMISTTPIQYWSQLSTWLYVFKYKLPYNRLYMHGFDRLGCFMCPSCALAEFEEIRKVYPELWERWEKVLIEWKNKLGMPDSWIKFGLWRWLSPATAKKRVARHVPDYAVNEWKKEYSLRLNHNRSGLVPITAIKANGNFVIKFNKPLVPSELADVFIKNAAMLGFKLVNEAPLVLEKNGVEFAIRHDEIRLSTYTTEAFEDCVDLIKTIYRMQGCVRCGSCVLWTKPGSVMLTSKGPTPRQTLSESEARVYIEVCPISDQLVEKVVLSLILDDYRAFKRKSRRHV